MYWSLRQTNGVADGHNPGLINGHYFTELALRTESATSLGTL
jgi:hypothetical protein